MPENDEGPVTLASLRGRRSRTGAKPPGGVGDASSGARSEEKLDRAPQMGLLFAEAGAAGEAPRRTEQPTTAALPIRADRLPGHLQLREEAARAERAEAATAPWGITSGGEPRDGDLRAQEPRLGEQRLSEQRLGEPRPREPRKSENFSERRVWSVRALVADVRGRIEGGYGEVWVEGEISNCRPAASGHLYLTLKDGDVQLPVVLFRRQAQLLRFRPNAGMAVLVRGRLSLYEGRGELQLIGEVLEPRGAGALLVAFEQLKARLAAEGLFESSRKRALPPFPKCVGVITSLSGAVLHDIVTVVRRRHGRLNLLVYPALVQGPGCPASVMAGLRWFNRNPERVELIVVARGGGAPEDLAGFNDEALARAIAASELPVISAVGHETDFSIADFVADLRAATPSAAAEIMTQSQHRIEERVEALERSLKRAARYRLLEAHQRFARMSAEHVLRRVQQGLDRRQQRLDDLQRRMLQAMERERASRERRMDLLRGRLERQNVATRLIWGRDRLARIEDRFREALARGEVRRRGRLDRAAARLEALSPLAVLARGYALLYTVEDGVEGGNLQGMSGEGGGLITSSTDTAPGRRIRARLANGSLLAEVTETEQG